MKRSNGAQVSATRPDVILPTRFAMSSRAVMVGGFATLVGLMACYGELVLGYLGHRTWYDDGVYMGAAIQLSRGIVPYRDFVFLHPPGVVVGLLPIALLGRLVGTGPANEVGRVLIAVVAIAGVVVFARVVRTRPTLAVAAGLAIFALHPDVLLADEAIYLEPLLILACLVGTALVFDGEQFAAKGWRWWAGGVAFGLASAIKLWAAFPMLVVIGIAVIVRRRGEVARFTIAAFSSFAVVCAPFLLLAPTAFVRYIFVVQASRSDPRSATLTRRLGNLFDIPTPVAGNHVVVGAAVVLILSVLAWSILRDRRHPLSTLEWYSLTSAGLVVAAFALSGDYYEHYGAFAALFFGLVASGTVARLTTVDSRAASQLKPNRPPTAAITTGLIVAAVLLVGYGAQLLRTTTPNQNLSSDSLARIEGVLRPGRCIVTDNVSILIMSGRFAASRAGCPHVVDSFGTALALTDGDLGQVVANAAVQQEWQNWLEAADDLVLNEPNLRQAADADSWNHQVERYARTHFSLIERTGDVTTYQRSQD